MLWTYRVCRDYQERYSIREVFYERDHTIIDYSKTPVALVGASIEELIQLVHRFKEAFDLPVLSLAEMDAVIARQDPRKSPTHRSISLEQVMAELAIDVDLVQHNEAIGETAIAPQNPANLQSS
jgi:hypothetical protein